MGSTAEVLCRVLALSDGQGEEVGERGGGLCEDLYLGILPCMYACNNVAHPRPRVNDASSCEDLGDV
jgi:hypothetical protein